MKTILHIFNVFYSFFLAHFKKSLNNRNFRLRWVFYLYLLLILIFANFYYFSYNIAPSSFVFAKDVHQSKLTSQIKEDSILIHNLENEASLLKYMLQRIAKPNLSKSDSIYSNFRYIFLRWHIKDMDLEIAINKLIFKTSTIGKIFPHKIALYERDENDPFFEREVSIKVTNSDIKSPEIIGEKIAKSRIEANSLELKQIKNADYLRWNFIDFFYFSTITQATVGYGDMLPNSTFIRFLVALQTLIGIFVTIIMVTYSYDLYKSRKEKN